MLGMYDMPTLQPANDRFWGLIRTQLGGGPSRLTRDRDVWDVWLDPDLVFAQTCGMPYRTRLHGKVQLVGTPNYGLPGCAPGYYCSVIVAREGDERDLTALTQGIFAYNEALSQSGWAAPITHLSGMNLTPTAVLETGGHALSAQAVADRRADFASLDALTWALLKEHTNLGDSLREIASTTPTPALPYITSNGQDADHVADAVQAAIANLSTEDKQVLHIQGLLGIPADRYLTVPTPPTPQALQPDS
ncbi:PhnD/SsuA/transferrin family substrate-binding protein [Rhodobacteraceae bacterium B1Z28]|uniref:PhnD/SsuA/transferrin family substrate-binding protein n=1 Tax=Ruegeria haliotis TaxID=2747601 RepID=A0ABX2PL28_9RHOB|nr:PhnD/SsuA/transferrin family substrate-binding protein [Ruegeria haliotis]NVO54806.1 PhnD/SsuA/transferrin family substrate-binding protein [Ruegeria haliotis]